MPAIPPTDPTAFPLEEWEVLDLLTHLVEKSLVLFEEDAQGQGRYRLLESVRQYGGDRLRAAQNDTLFRQQHAEFYLALAEESAPKLHTFEQLATLTLLEKEHDNLRIALEWFLTQEDGDEKSVRLAASLFWFWQIHSHYTEGPMFLSRALKYTEALGNTSARATALQGAGQLAFYNGDYTTALELLTNSETMWREIGDAKGHAYSQIYLAYVVAYHLNDVERSLALHQESVIGSRQSGEKWGLAMALWGMGTNLLLLKQEFAQARPLLLESSALFRELGDRWGLARPLFYLARLERSQGKKAEGRALLQESLEFVQEIGDQWSYAAWFYRLGNWAREDGDFAEATQYLTASLNIYRDIANRRDLADTLSAFAALAKAQDEPRRAVQLYAYADAMREAINAFPIPDERTMIDHACAELKTLLGETEYTAAADKGRALTQEQAVALALTAENAENLSKTDQSPH